MPRVVRNPLLREDLIDIWNYIADDSPTAADRLLDRFEEKFITLSQNPGIGQRRPEIGSDVRHFPVGNYLVLYRPILDGVEIVRVVHGQRDVTRLQL